MRNHYFKKIFILIIIFAVGSPFFYFFEGFALRVAAPFWRLENYILGSRRLLLEENNILKQKILELEKRIGSEASFATVLTRPPQTPYDIIVVDIESLSSVSLGYKAYLSSGEPIGTVSEILGLPAQTGNLAKIKLFSAVGEETPAMLERHSVPVKLLGTGGGNFRIELPRDVAVEKGDKIIFADSSLVAVVEDIELRTTKSFKEVLAKSPANIFSLRIVSIKPQ